MKPVSCLPHSLDIEISLHEREKKLFSQAFLEGLCHCYRLSLFCMPETALLCGKAAGRVESCSPAGKGAAWNSSIPSDIRRKQCFFNRVFVKTSFFHLAEGRKTNTSGPCCCFHWLEWEEQSCLDSICLCWLSLCVPAVPTSLSHTNRTSDSLTSAFLSPQTNF